MDQARGLRICSIRLTLVGCYLLCASAYGWNEPDGFKKLKWGDPIDGVKEVMKARDREIRNIGPRGKRFTREDSVGDVPVTLYLDFLDGKLAGVSFTSRRLSSRRSSRRLLSVTGRQALSSTRRRKVTRE